MIFCPPAFVLPPVQYSLAFAVPAMIWTKTRVGVLLLGIIGLLGGRYVYQKLCKDEEECAVEKAPWILT